MLHMCFVDLVKAFHRVPGKMLEWVLRKKGITEVLVRSVMSLYEDQGQESEWILSCQRSLSLKWGCTKHMCCHLFFLLWLQMLSLNWPERVREVNCCMVKTYL